MTSKKYLIALPKTLGRVAEVIDFNKIPYIGGVFSATEGEAVSNYVFRFTENNSPIKPCPINPTEAKIVLNTLNKRYGGVERFALEVPEIVQTNEDLLLGEKLTPYEKKFMTELPAMNFAREVYNRDITEKEVYMIRKGLRVTRE